MKINYTENKSLDQSKGLKIIYRESFGEYLLFPITTYDKMKTNYPIQVIDLEFQKDHVTPKKVRLVEEFVADPIYTNAFLHYSCFIKKT